MNRLPETIVPLSFEQYLQIVLAEEAYRKVQAAKRNYRKPRRFTRFELLGTVIALGITVVLLCMSAYAAQRRDPFASRMPVHHVIEIPKLDATFRGVLESRGQLTAIIVSHNRTYFVHDGGQVLGSHVVAITRESVVLNSDGRVVTLPLGAK